MISPLSIRRARAQLVHQAAANSEAVSLEDVRALPKFAGWSPAILEHAIADCLNAGTFTVVDGTLVVEAWT